MQKVKATNSVEGLNVYLATPRSSIPHGVGNGDYLATARCEYVLMTCSLLCNCLFNMSGVKQTISIQLHTIKSLWKPSEADDWSRASFLSLTRKKNKKQETRSSRNCVCDLRVVETSLLYVHWHHMGTLGKAGLSVTVPLLKREWTLLH